MDIQPGTVIDVWCVEKRLGSGGMGAVYRCFNRAAPRIRAALKVLDPSLSYDPEIRARFIREAEVLFQLDHPHIVKVRNVNMDASPPFIEMAFCQGTPLDALLSRGPLPPGVVALIGSQLATALAHVHSRGIRHRDVKPGNVIVNGDHATLVDFGIATEGAHRTMNLKGSALGTVAYAPPEWGGRTAADPILWDAYSLGVLLWECVTGRVAFPMPRDMDIREGVFHVLSRKREPGVLDLDDSVPELLRRVIGQLTATDTEVRRGDLEAISAELAPLARTGSGVLPEVGELGAPDVTPHVPRNQGTQTISFDDGPADTGVFDLDLAPGAIPGVAPAGPQRAPAPNLAGGGVADLAPAPIRDAPPAAPVEPAAPAQPEPTPDAASPIPPPVAPARSRTPLLVGGLVAAAALGAVAWWSAQPAGEVPGGSADASPRIVQVALDGTAPPGTVAVIVDGVATDVSAGVRLVPGPHKLRVLAGVGCDAGAEAQPDTCGVEEKSIVVPAGDTVFPVRLGYPVAAPPGLVVRLAGASASRWRVDGGDWSDLDGETLEVAALSPGAHTVVVQGGTCPDEPCGDACKETCSEASGTVSAPFSATAGLRLELTLPDRKEPVAASPGRRRVTQRQFAKWLKSHPNRRPSAARGTARADARYMKSWSVKSATGAPAHQVPPIIAAEYCGRRGLADVGAAPKTWDGSGAIHSEIRSGPGGAPVLLASSGSTSPIGGKSSVTGAGFRCR